MKRFSQRELDEAKAHAAAGGQALHVCASAQFVTDRAPGCFQRTTIFAHLLDQDVERLKETARKLGVRVIQVERVGEAGQHVDLCGSPLHRALVWADAEKAAARQEQLAL